jgi:hypothetical protein
MSAVRELLLGRLRVYQQVREEGRIPNGVPALIPIEEVLAALDVDETAPEVTITTVAEMDATPRADHLARCKQRALEYVDLGDNAQAFDSLVSDLGKHPETRNHAAIELGMMLLLGGQLNTAKQMRDFITGCN